MRTRNRWVSLAVGAGVALTAVVVPVVSSTTASAADQKRDGRTESRALASCWEIKQVDPSAPDGRYWLYTPALQYPQQFWCDMTNDTVSALLNRAAPTTLDDGLRVRRAKNAAGTSWQELRLKFGGMTYWSWALGGGYGLTEHSFDGAAAAGGSSKATCDDDTFRCVSTVRNKGNTYLPGFAYGQRVTGSPAAKSDLWAAKDGG